MANAVITSATGGLGATGMATILTVLADTFLGVKRARGHILKYCNTDGAGVGVPHGTVRFMVPPAGTTPNDDTDGTSPSYDDTVAASKDVTLSVHKSVKFGFSQIAQTLDGGRAINPVVGGRMADLFNAVEADICTLASTFSTNTGGTGATAVDRTAIALARTQLVNKNVPAGDPLMALWKPGATAWGALTTLADFNEYRIRGERPSAYDPGNEFGVVPIYDRGVYHLESQNVKQATAAEVVTQYNFMFHRDAILVAMKAPMIPTSPGVEAMNFKDPDSEIEFQILKYWDKDTDAEALKIHTLYGKALGREDWGALILS